jgi:hypothetical protein
MQRNVVVLELLRHVLRTRKTISFFILVFLPELLRSLLIRLFKFCSLWQRWSRRFIFFLNAFSAGEFASQHTFHFSIAFTSSMMEIMVLLELLLYYILNTQKFSLMPVYGEGASNVCRPTAISGALATASAGETTIYVTAPVVKIEQPTALNLEQVLKSFSPSGWRKTIILFCFFALFNDRSLP